MSMKQSVVLQTTLSADVPAWASILGMVLAQIIETEVPLTSYTLPLVKSPQLV